MTMDMRLQGKIVVVSGASKGIGYACAEAFAAEGARVVIVSRSQANLDAAVARFPGATHPPTPMAADMTRADDAERMIAAVEREVGAIDVLVNSAGAARRYAPADLNAQAWHDAMNAKFFSTIHPTDAVLKRMLARKRGVIVNIIGMGGKIANPVHLPGGAANAALMLATTGLAAAYASSGIRVNGINPGGTLTRRATCWRETRRKFRWGASPSRKKSRASRYSSPRSRQATSPARSCRWTAEPVP